MYYFAINNLLSKCQFGFTKGWSIVLQLLNIFYSWNKHLDKYESI